MESRYSIEFGYKPVVTPLQSVGAFYLAKLYLSKGSLGMKALYHSNFQARGNSMKQQPL